MPWYARSEGPAHTVELEYAMNVDKRVDRVLACAFPGLIDWLVFILVINYYP